MSDTQMVTSIGARNAIERRTGTGTSRTKNGITFDLSNGRKHTQTPQKQRRSVITRRTKSAALQSILSGLELTGRSETRPAQEGWPQNYAPPRHGRIKTRLSEFTPKLCASRKKQESENTSTISFPCKANLYVVFMLNRTYKFLMVRKTRANEIQDGPICHKRIEDAQRQASLFEAPAARAEQHGLAL